MKLQSLRSFSSDIFISFLLNKKGFISASNWKSRGSSVSEVCLIQWLLLRSLYSFPQLSHPHVLVQEHLIALPQSWISSYCFGPPSSGSQHRLLISDYMYFIIAFVFLFSHSPFLLFVVHTSFTASWSQIFA